MWQRPYLAFFSLSDVVCVSIFSGATYDRLVSCAGLYEELTNRKHALAPSYPAR